jgi:transcription initiation factor TFIIIB Brf1 subunit/transcription initiation factor TFIIB
MTTANTTMNAKEAYEIALNDPIARITNKSSLEDVIKTHLGYAVWYARDVIKGRWIEIEDSIKTSPEHAFAYAFEVIRFQNNGDRGRWIEGEDIIKTSPEYALRYAKNIIKGRWIEGENIIATDPKSAHSYCTDLGRCEAVERHIIEKRLHLVDYREHNNRFFCYDEKDRNVEKAYQYSYQNSYELPKHVQEAIKCYYHVIDVIKGRWIEAEDILKQYDTVWKMYQEFLETIPLTDDEWAEKVKNECQSILTRN